MMLKFSRVDVLHILEMSAAYWTLVDRPVIRWKQKVLLQAKILLLNKPMLNVKNWFPSKICIKKSVSESVVAKEVSHCKLYPFGEGKHSEMVIELHPTDSITHMCVLFINTDTTTNNSLFLLAPDRKRINLTIGEKYQPVMDRILKDFQR